MVLQIGRLPGGQTALTRQPSMRAEPPEESRLKQGHTPIPGQPTGAQRLSPLAPVGGNSAAQPNPASRGFH